MSNSIEKLYEAFLKAPVICTDSRNIIPNSIFFALKGGNFNGNLFASSALAEGCALAVVDDEEVAENDKYFLVDDVLYTLQDLATFHRKKLQIPIIALTGSNGKTTTKELINAVLSTTYNVSATVGNLNNHIGVPLTLLKLTDKHEYGIVEMGANHQGEIAQLCEIALPDFCLITNIGKAHLEGFGGEEGVIKGKSEMYKYADKNNKKVFVNADNDLLVNLSKDLDKITYGTSGKADYNGKLISDNPFVKIQLNNEEPAVNTQIIGSYNFENILSAACIGNYFNIEFEKIKEGLEGYIPSSNRSQVLSKATNTILLDAYNANPSSMEAAILNLAASNAENKVAILGDMLELGEESKKEHERIIKLLKEKKINYALLVGPHFQKVQTDCKSFKDATELSDYLKSNKITNSTILIKGSRGIKLETILDSLA